MLASGRRWKVVAGHGYRMKEHVAFPQRWCSLICGLFAGIAGEQFLN